MTIANYLHNTQLNKKLTRSRIAALAVLSLFAVIGVFWWLKLIGIAMAGEAFCGMEEHSHGDACTVRTLICTEAEADTHVHEDVCYSLSYTCGKEEHIHTVSCYSDRTADLETARIWEETMRNISRTGNPDADLVSIALTQLGYNESTKNFEVNDSGERNGYTRYGEWYGSPYGKWSAMFVSFCLHYADIPSDAAPYRSGCETMRLAWDDRGFILAATNYVPIAGDIVFLDNDANGNADAVGIVCETANNQITVIEGDYENAVCQTVYDLTDSRILDYGSLVEIVRGMATEEDLVRVESVIQKIDALPSYETVDNTLTQYDDANDLDGYLGYWNVISEQVKETYILWQGLDKFRLLVPNSAHLGELNWTWSTQILPANDTDSIVVRQINKSATGGSGLAAPIVVYGGTIANKLSGNVLSNMLYWDAYVIEQSDKGLYVAQIVRSGTAKGSLKASTSNGFVLLVHDDYDAESRDFSAEVGDWITVDFNYKTTGAYKASGYGTVTRTASNTAKLSTVESADTRDLIEVNLYNYTDKVNTNYNNDKLYPGFQNPGGLEPSISTDMTAIENLSGGGFDFGDNITADTGIATVTKAATAQGINRSTKAQTFPSA